MARQDEILRLLIQVAGQEEVAGLADAIDELAGSGDKGAEAAEALVKQLDELAKAKAATADLVKFKAALADTDAALAEAEAGLIALNAQFSAADSSSKAVTSAFKKAGDAVERLQAQQRAQTLELQRAQGVLARAAVDTTKLASESDRLGRELSQTAQSLRLQASAAGAASGSLAKHAATAERGVGIFNRLKAAFAGFIAALGVRELARGAAAIIEMGEASEKAERQFGRLFGSADAGKAALKELEQLASDLGQDFDSLRVNAAKLKTFGLDPLDGTLQALIDQNVAAGGSNEDLEGKILAVGQAWSKQKLQGEEILQLVERGVPVWDLLSKATGKNVVELQKLSEQGKLGRTEMRLLIQEIGKANQGAAADSIQGLTARLTVLQNKLRIMGAEFAREGATDALADSLGRVTQELATLAASPEFAKLKNALTSTFRDALAVAEEFLQAGTFQKVADQVASSIEAIRGVVNLLTADMLGANSSLIDLFTQLADSVQKPLQLLQQLAGIVGTKLTEGLDDGRKAADELEASLKAVKREADGMNPVAAAIEAMFGAAQRVATDKGALIQKVLQEMGVDAQNAGVEITEAGKKIIGNLNFLAAEAAATGVQFRAAFAKGIDAAQTVVEVQKMEAALRKAFENGKISVAEYSVFAQKAAEKTIEIKAAANEASGAISGIGDAAERESRRTIAAMEATRSSLAATADDLARKLGQALESGASPDTIRPLRDELTLTEKGIDTLSDKIGETKAGLEQAGEAGAQAGTEIQQGAEKAADATEQVSESASDAGTAIGAVLSALIAMNTKFGAISENARQYFVDAYNSSVRLSLSLTDVEAAIFRAEAATDAAIASQRASAEQMTRAYEEFAESAEAAGAAAQFAVRGGEQHLRDFAAAAREGHAVLELLGQADLDALAASAERAAKKVAEIESKAKSATAQLEAMNRTLKDKQDEAAGNQAAVLEREHQDRLQRIEELAQQAGERGRAVAEDTRRRAEDDYQAELARIREKAKVEAEAARQTGDARAQAAARETQATRPAAGKGSTGAAGEVVVKFRNELNGADPINLDQDSVARITQAVLAEIQNSFHLSGR